MSIQNYNTWSQAASGLKWLPLSMTLQALSIGVGILAGVTNWKTVRETFFPSSCVFPGDETTKKVASLLVGYEFVARIATEEFLFRTLLQHQLLRQTPKAILSTVAPSAAPWVDGAIARTVRVALSAFGFSAFHLINQFSFEQMNLQLCNTFGLGIASAIVQEKTGNTWGSIGLHAGWNILAWASSIAAPCWTHPFQEKVSVQDPPAAPPHASSNCQPKSFLEYTKAHRLCSRSRQGLIQEAEYRTEYARLLSSYLNNNKDSNEDSVEELEVLHQKVESLNALAKSLVDQANEPAFE